MNEEIQRIIHEMIRKQTLILAVLSGTKHKETALRITIRPLLIKNQLRYQLSETKEKQVLHQNLTADESIQFLLENLLSYKQVHFYTTEADYQILISKKEKQTLLKKAPSKQGAALTHNRTKQYILEEGAPIPFLVELGIMNASGRVYPQRQDKFRQVNRFLEMVEDVVGHLDVRRPLRVIDFGCGKAYLTFGLYYYLHVIKGYDVSLIGLDLKSDVIQTCQQLASGLNYKGLSFILGDINQYENQAPVDMVVSLHACDTATDAALEKAVAWQANVILCAPCCQHELFKQLENPLLEPLLKHGIFKERLTALVTDAARAQLLEVVGYQVQVIEFIDVEHTPKNLMIRAIRRKESQLSKEALKVYQDFKEQFHILPSLEKRLEHKLNLK